MPAYGPLLPITSRAETDAIGGIADKPDGSVIDGIFPLNASGAEYRPAAMPMGWGRRLVTPAAAKPSCFRLPRVRILETKLLNVNCADGWPSPQ